MNTKRIAAVIALLGGAGYFVERFGLVDLPGVAMDYAVAGATGAALVLAVRQMRERAASNG